MTRGKADLVNKPLEAGNLPGLGSGMDRAHAIKGCHVWISSAMLDQPLEALETERKGDIQGLEGERQKGYSCFLILWGEPERLHVP